MEISNKVIIVTGASQGIGAATAKLLGEKGAKVVLAARLAEAIKKLAESLPDALAVPTDMRKEGDIKNLIDKTLEKYGRLDILINNAGQGMYALVEATNLENYKKIMDINVYSVLEAMQMVIPQMRKQGGGMILNISSRVSKNYFPGLAAYASTKYALNAISLTARQELAKEKIVVSVFHPKMTSSNFGKNAIGRRPEWVTNLAPNRPRPEIDTPEQVAEKIAELIISEEPEASM